MVSKIKNAVYISMGALLSLPTIAFGGTLDPGTGGGEKTFSIDKPEGALSNIPQLMSWAIQLLFVIAGLVAFVYLLLGGIKWITSGGDKAAVEGARGQIIQALIGLVVVFAAWGMIVLVEKLLGIGLGFSSPISLPDPSNLQTDPTF